MNKKPEIYKCVRIFKEDNKFYAKLNSTNIIEISVENALQLFMTCTSYAGDIKNKLYYIKGVGLYPEHSDEIQSYINNSRNVNANISNNSEMQFGSIVQMNNTSEHLFYIGIVYASLYSCTRYVKGCMAPNSSKYHAFIDYKDRIHFIGTKSDLKNICTVLPDDTESPLKHTFFNYNDAVLYLNTKAQQADNNFFELGTKQNLQIVFVHYKKYKAEDLECTKRMSSFTLGELIATNSLNSVRHFVTINSRDISFKIPHLIPKIHYSLQVKILEFYLT